MNWHDLAGSSDSDSDEFFESKTRVSSVTPLDVLSDDDDDFQDTRASFTVHSFRKPSSLSVAADQPPAMDNYLVWMAGPGSIKERRKRLFQGMGVNSNLSRLFTFRLSRKFSQSRPASPPHPPIPPVVDTTTTQRADHADLQQGLPGRSSETADRAVGNEQSVETSSGGTDATSSTASPVESSTHVVLCRSRSDSDMESDSVHAKRRREEMIGLNVSKQRLARTSSSLTAFARTSGSKRNSRRTDEGGDQAESDNSVRVRRGRSGLAKASSTGDQLGAFFLIKNLDTGKEFIVKEFDEDGMWNRLSDLQTGKQLTMDEFERTVGYSPVVKELMRRQIVDREAGYGGSDRKMNALTRSFRYSRKMGVSILKNIKSSVALGSNSEEEVSTTEQEQRQNPIHPSRRMACSERVKVRQQGKTHKELTALRLCQEIQAHEGSIWTMKFNADGRYLASAGEDKVIHVWEVQECEMLVPTPEDDEASIAYASTDQNLASDKKKGKSSSKRIGRMPDHVQLPETIFALSEKPFCSFTGHVEDVLDVSWSNSQLHLLSSSMDKSVRLWDLETKACLKVFAHNDYVTCIQFNPVDSNYFISGSLDAKLRLWSIPGRRVVDWVDVHEMVTAACYSPDGQTTTIGTHKGSCRTYSTADGRLTQLSQFNIPNKYKKAAKITGFEFSPGSSSELLITSADSRIRIYDGEKMINKFMGFQNTSSQIAASFSPCGKHIICASEDSHVFVWRREEPDHGSTNTGKIRTRVITRSHEQFLCKNVTTAIPWPGSIKYDPPTVTFNTKKASKQQHSSQPPSASGSPKADSTSKKHQLPPLPRKNNNKNIGKEATSPVGSERIARTEPGELGESLGSTSSRHGYSPSYSTATWPAWSAGWSWFEGGGGGSQGGDRMQAAAWGLVVVTAGLGGEIRAYQNVGLPLRVGRQKNLFS